MRNHSLFLWVLLFMDGVFGADEVKPVSVMKGDSVTLHTGVTELQSDDIIEWMSEDDIIIAKMKNDIISINDVPDRRFEDRLLLDHQNGSLTIRNIARENGGLYKLDVRGGHQISKRFNVTVYDVMESVSVTEGDTVTLHTGVTKIQRDDQILWKFGDQGTLIACLNDPVDKSWSNIDLNDQTGELTIGNIQDDQYGIYKVEINTRNMILHRNVCINNSDGVKNVSVKKGEPVALRTGVIDIQRYDLVLWKFEDHLIAEINKGTNNFILYDSGDKRFKDRLQPNEKTGSLTISDSETTDSGVYHLHMCSSRYTLQRTISVNVKGLSSVVIAVISVSLALVVAVALVIYCWCRLRQSRDRVV